MLGAFPKTKGLAALLVATQWPIDNHLSSQLVANRLAPVALGNTPVLMISLASAGVSAAGFHDTLERHRQHSAPILRCFRGDKVPVMPHPPPSQPLPGLGAGWHDDPRSHSTAKHAAHTGMSV